jgi:hypothetical protein
MYLFSSELVDTVTLTHEHNLQLLAIWEVIDVFSQLAVDCVSLQWNVNSDASLKIDDVLLEGCDFLQSCLKFKLTVLEGGQELDAGLLRFQELTF